MYKMKLTKKEVMGRYNCVCVGYCELSYLLKYESEIGYTSGVYGWNADIYYLGNNTVLVTGYRPFGKRLDYNFIKDFEDRAREIANTVESYDQRENDMTLLLEEFKRAVL